MVMENPENICVCANFLYKAMYRVSIDVTIFDFLHI